MTQTRHKGHTMSDEWITAAADEYESRTRNQGTTREQFIEIVTRHARLCVRDEKPAEEPKCPTCNDTGTVHELGTPYDSGKGPCPKCRPEQVEAKVELPPCQLCGKSGGVVHPQTPDERVFCRTIGCCQKNLMYTPTHWARLHAPNRLTLRGHPLWSGDSVWHPVEAVGVSPPRTVAIFSDLGEANIYASRMIRGRVGNRISIAVTVEPHMSDVSKCNNCICGSSASVSRGHNGRLFVGCDVPGCWAGPWSISEESAIAEWNSVIGTKLAPPTQ